MRRMITKVWCAATAGALAAAVLLFPGGPCSHGQPAAAAAPAQPADAVDDLAMVPADAVGFIHVRLADLWKHEVFAEFRKTWEAAGVTTLAAFDRQFVPAPSTISRLTAFVVLDEKHGPQPIVLLTFSAAFDPAEVIRANLPAAEKGQASGKTVYTDKRMGVAITFPDNRHILVGPDQALTNYLAKAPATDGPLAPALKLAAWGRPVVAALNIAALPIPPQSLEEFPPEVRPLLKAKLVLASLDLGADARFELEAVYANEDAARAAETAARATIDLGRKELVKFRHELEGRLAKPNPNAKGPRPFVDFPEAAASVFAVGALNRIDAFLANPKLITRRGAGLSASLTIPKELMATAGAYSAVAVGLLLPAVQKVRMAAARAQSANNLQQIGIAIHSFYDAHNRFPRDIRDKNGKPILSWRVELLPYLEQAPLYRQFKLDEPWDGPNNRNLSKVMLKVFMSPNAPPPVSPDGYGLTSYKGVAGPGTIFDPKVDKLTFPGITDGLSNTVAVVETGDPIPWAKPGDYVVDPSKPLAAFPTSPGLGDVLAVLMCDGSVRVVSKTVSEMTLRAAFTRAGGEPIDLDR